MWGGLTKFPSPFFPVDDITKALVCVQLPLQIGTRYFLFVNHDMSSDGSNNMELKDMERNTVSDEDQSAHDSKELADNKAKSSMDSHDNQPSSAESQPAGYDGSAAVEPSPVFHRRTGFFIFFKDLSSVFKLDELGLEIAHIAVPAALALAADPLASLIDTAFIGRIGPVELAAVGVSIAIFNQVSKVAIYPLVSVTTSFVAEENASCKVSDDEHETGDLEKNAVNKVNNEENKAKDLEENASRKASNEEHKGKDLEQACQHNGETEVLAPCKNSKKAICFPSCVVSQGRDCGEPKHEKKYIPSVSSAMVVGAVLGLLQACLLISAAKPALNIMGVKSDSPMMAPAKRYLTLRSIGAPAVLLSLAMQGVFRGFKDTKTPLYASVAGDLTNIILDPILIFAFRWGVTGAAIAHVLSQYLIVLILFGRLVKMVKVLPPSIWDLKFSRFLKCGFLLLARVIAVTFCVTLAASMAARQGPIPMAAFQVCLQLWLATSLLADGLAVAGQAILASAFAKGEIKKAVAAASRVLQLSIVLGVGLSLFLAIFIEYGSGVFSKDKNVLKLIHICIPFVAGTQPLNSLAFVFDGVNFGASDYVFSAYSMVVVAAISIPCVFLLSSSNGFVGIWIALVIYITLRTLAGVWRLGAARGPWSFLIL